MERKRMCNCGYWKLSSRIHLEWTDLSVSESLTVPSGIHSTRFNVCFIDQPDLSNWYLERIGLHQYNPRRMPGWDCLKWNSVHLNPGCSVFKRIYNAKWTMHQSISTNLQSRNMERTDLYFKHSRELSSWISMERNRLSCPI